LREAKALVPTGTSANGNSKYEKLDFLKAAEGPLPGAGSAAWRAAQFHFRRIAGDAEKIELGRKAGAAEIHLGLLQAMGFDLASIHAASPQRRRDSQLSRQSAAPLAERRCRHHSRQSSARFSGMEEIHEQR
jgi:hypothetical protein